MRSGAALKTMMGVIPKEEQEAPSLPMERETLVMQGEQAETPPPPPKPTLAEENARLRARVAALEALVERSGLALPARSEAFEQHLHRERPPGSTAG